MINIKSLQPLAWGSNRLCFEHPHDRYKCLKIVYSNRGTTNSSQEHREYRRLLGEMITEEVPLARHYESIDTSHGPAIVRELIRDFDGSVSLTLLQCLNKTTYQERPACWEEALSDFRRWLWQHAVLAVDMTPSNICVQQLNDASLRLVLIDGLGHHDRLNLVEHCKLLRRWKLRRHIQKRGLDSMSALLSIVDHYRARVDLGTYPDGQTEFDQRKMS